MQIRTFLPAAAALAFGATPVSAERQQQAEIRKVDCHVTFAAYGSDEAELQSIDTKGARKVRPKAKAGGSHRGSPLRPCIVLASA